MRLRGEHDRPAQGAVLVTGASSGIGRDAALHLNRLGYTVIAGVRRDADGERLAGDAARRDTFHHVLLDVADAEQVRQAPARVAGLLPAGTVLVGLFSNAGIAAMSGDVSCEGCPIETQQRVMDVNFFGAVRVVQAFLPMLRASRGTIVVNTALMTHTVIPFNGGYAASKAALEAWADTLRREVRPHGVRVAMIRAAAISSSLEAKQDPSRIPDDTPYPAQRPMITFFIDSQRRHADDPACAPRRVSELVAEALASPHPPPRRIIGGGARPIYALGCLPDRVQDAVFARMLARFARRGGGRGVG